jgi:nucleotide-binding universal stress UspA family protein
MRVLIPLDGSAVAEAALAHGEVLGRAFCAELVLLQVLPTDPASAGIVADVLDWQIQRIRAETYLEEARTRLEDAGRAASTMVLEGSVVDEIARVANAGDIDVVVLTATGQGATAAGQLGGTVGKLLPRLESSLVLVRSADGTPAAPLAASRPIVVPLDGSPGSSWSARVAAAIALTMGAGMLLLRVVQAVDAPAWAGYSRKTRQLAEDLSEMMRVEADNWLRMLRTHLPESLEVDMQVVVAPGVCRAIREIVSAKRPGLLVMSAHGLDTDADCRYGEVAEHLLAHARCPILVLQSPQAEVGADVTAQSGSWRIPAVA